MSQVELNVLSKDLGNPSIQKLLFILTVYDQLPINKLLELSGLSESQLHLTIKKMLNIKLIKKITRGMYSLTDDQFMLRLKEAYKTKIVDDVNTKINEIWNYLKKNNLEESFNLFKEIDRFYGPILVTNFSYQLNSLSHEFLDKQI